MSGTKRIADSGWRIGKTVLRPVNCASILTIRYPLSAIRFEV
jgi:hypothetical protein